MAVDERLKRFAATDARFGDGTFLALLAITGVALVARLFALGTRVAHWDEGRVGYWILRYMETGEWFYRAEIHGPFLQLVNPFVFGALGANDFSARLVVAVIGALLPLSAWLFRERLRDSEMVALALLLALDPFLLYYSRFMRSDVPLAAFMIFALGFYVRTLDTRNRSYLYLGTAMLALAFTTKENVLVYLVTWAGAAVLLFDHRLFRAGGRGERGSEVASRRLAAAARELWTWRGPLLLAAVEFLAIVVLFYAPRPDLWQAFSDPAMFPDVIHEATVGSWNEFTGQWVGGAMEDGNDYLAFAKPFVTALFAGSAPLVVLAVAGFVADRYAPEGPRDLVAFAAYWGFVTILGYPLITDIKAPWGPVHVVVPLAFPAAVGLALLYRWGRDSLADDDRLGAAFVALVLLVVTAQVGLTAANTTYLVPQDADNELVQYGQPAEGIGETLATVRTAIDGNDGDDVYFYGYVDDGNYVLYVPNEAENDDPPAGGGWYERLPLPWYLELYDAQVNSTDSTRELAEHVEAERPPVVIARAKHRAEVEPHLSGYEDYEHELTLWGSETVFYVDRERLPADEARSMHGRAHIVSESGNPYAPA